MRILKLLVLLALTGVLTTGCGKFFKQKTDGWDAEMFYTKAKEELDDKKWEKAIELYQQGEARFPYGEYAEQSHMPTTNPMTVRKPWPPPIASFDYIQPTQVSTTPTI